MKGWGGGDTAARLSHEVESKGREGSLLAAILLLLAHCHSICHTERLPSAAAHCFGCSVDRRDGVKK